MPSSRNWVPSFCHHSRYHVLCVCVCVHACTRMHVCSVVFNSLWPHGLFSTSASVDGIFKAIILEQFAIFFSRGSSWPTDRSHVSWVDKQILYHWATWEAKYHAACMLSRFSGIQLFATLRTISCQAPLSIGFPRQEYWSGLPFPFPEVQC